MRFHGTLISFFSFLPLGPSFDFEGTAKSKTLELKRRKANDAENDDDDGGEEEEERSLQRQTANIPTPVSSSPCLTPTDAQQRF